MTGFQRNYRNRYIGETFGSQLKINYHAIGKSMKDSSVFFITFTRLMLAMSRYIPKTVEQLQKGRSQALSGYYYDCQLCQAGRNYIASGVHPCSLFQRRNVVGHQQ